MPDRQLITRLGGEYVQMLAASMPRIEAAVARGYPALVRVDMSFSRGEDGSIICTMKPTEKISAPVPSTVELKLALTGSGQLSLFEGEET